jgi:hypothetical protein
VLLTVDVPQALGEKVPPPVPDTTTLFDTVLVAQGEGLGIQEADTVTLTTAVGVTVPLNPTHLPRDAIQMPLHMGGANKLVQEDPKWGTGSPADPPHTPNVSAGCKKEEAADPPPHLLTHVLFREKEVVKADKLEHEAAVATGLHLTLFASHTNPALHRGWDKNIGLGVAKALALPCNDGLATGVLEVEGVDTPALTVPTLPLPLALKVGDSDPKGEAVVVGEGEEEKVPFKLREGEGTREGVLAHIGDPDTLYVGVNVDTEEGEGCKGVPLPLTLLLLTTLLDTVGVNEGL